MLEKCFEKYCDKRHPQLCYYFEKYKRCKFSIYCSCKHHNKSQDTNKERYDDICEEVEKLKAEVFTLKQNVTNMASELEKLKASENTIIEVITDEEIEERLSQLFWKRK